MRFTNYIIIKNAIQLQNKQFFGLFFLKYELINIYNNFITNSN